MSSQYMWFAHVHALYVYTHIQAFAFTGRKKNIWSVQGMIVIPPLARSD